MSTVKWGDFLYTKETFFNLIDSLGVTNKELSNGTGISTGNISDWKKGKSKPKIEAIEKIADYLNCSIDFLLNRTDNPEINKSAPPIKEIKLAAESISSDAVIRRKKKLS